MSSRPIRKKQANRLRKALRQTPEQFLDPVQWLLDHGHARSKREARVLILDERLRADSHKVGFEEVNERDLQGNVKQVRVVCGVPYELRPRLLVASA